MTSSPTPDLAPGGELWVTILAGGIGSRFWPASTPEHPKQLLPLGSDRPLVSDTVDRALDLVPVDRLRILAGRHLVDPFRSALPDLPGSVYLVEPMARGTGPVLTWAAWQIHRRSPDAVLVSLHSDHVVGDSQALSALLRVGAGLATREGSLFTLGALPDRPETGFGYIRPGKPLDTPADARAFKVDAFIEKPALPEARRYLEEGYLWNTGMFIWQASVFLEEVSRLAPEIAPHLRFLEEGDDERFFRECSTISVDEAVLERSDRVCCLQATFPWDDVGSWEALSRTRDHDSRGNVVAGPGVVIGGSDNIVFSEDAPVVLWELDGLVVVRTGSATLVMPRDRAPDLKRLLALLPPELGGTG
jgi:mannose-1-phosphate guanylyltransferase